MDKEVLKEATKIEKVHRKGRAVGRDACDDAIDFLAETLLEIGDDKDSKIINLNRYAFYMGLVDAFLSIENHWENMPKRVRKSLKPSALEITKKLFLARAMKNIIEGANEYADRETES